jgi:RimJ/RimL family protein N-acetyltransferase
MQPLDFSQNLILEDDVALLRPLQYADLDHLMRFATDEKEIPIWKFSSLDAIGRENFTRYFDRAIGNRDRQLEFPFVVIDKRTNQYAGSTRFYDIQPQNATLQLGYTWYGTQFQDTGLNRHCKFLILSYAFEQLGIERVELRADNDNARSIAAMKRIGCQVDGILRSNMVRPDGTRRDSIVLSILKGEWFGGVKEKLEKMLKN